MSISALRISACVMSQVLMVFTGLLCDFNIGFVPVCMVDDPSTPLIHLNPKVLPDSLGLLYLQTSSPRPSPDAWQHIARATTQACEALEEQQMGQGLPGFLYLQLCFNSS